MNTSFPPTVFLTTANGLDQLPKDQGAEVAFVGRSNSGKSTAINIITGRKGLARTSKIPGRTQSLVFFQIHTPDRKQQRLVDLPGYGYANVPDHKKETWEKNISAYLKTRLSLKGIVITMDIRHPLQEHDQLMLVWALHDALPIHILLTKADKLSRNQASQTLEHTKQQLAIHNPHITAQTFSVRASTEIKTARRTILNWLKATH